MWKYLLSLGQVSVERNWGCLGSSYFCMLCVGDLSVIHIFKTVSPKYRAGTHIMFVIFQVTQRYLGQKVENICKEVDLRIVAT